MIIREAKLEDVDKIYNLGKFVEEFNVSGEAGIFWSKHILRNCIKSKTDWLILAEDNDEILGFVIVNNSPVFKKAVIENIFVLPQHRKKGIGKKLLTTVVEKIKETGYDYICILTEEDNKTAIDFFVSHGFNRGKNFAWLDKVIND